MGKSRMDTVIELVRELVAAQQRPLRVAEVGVFRGDLARAALKELGPKFIRFYFLVDPWRAYDQKPRNNQKEFDQMIQGLYKFSPEVGDRAIVLRATSLEAAALFADGAFDLVFIDAHHAYEHVMEDIRAWWPLVADTGVLAGHDYHKNWGEVVRAVDESFVEHTIRRLPGTVWAVEKDGKAIPSVRS